MNDRGNIVIYQTKDGKTSIDVKLENETVWLTQAQMAELFQKDRTVIGRHINNVYREGELERDITCAKFAHMGSYSDQQYETAVYNLDVIISVGYRKGDISHCFSCCDAASLTLIETIFFCLFLILRCLLLPAYHNTPASEHKPDSEEY